MDNNRDSTWLVMVFVFLFNTFLLIVILAFTPPSMSLLTTFIIALITYWYISAHEAIERHQSERLSTSLLSSMLLGIIVMCELYNVFDVSFLPEMIVLVMTVALIADYHNWKHEARYGLLAVVSIFHQIANSSDGRQL